MGREGSKKIRQNGDSDLTRLPHKQCKERERVRKRERERERVKEREGVKERG